MNQKMGLALICAASIGLGAIPAYAADNGDISVTINGEPITFSAQQPVIRDNITLVPVRGVLESLGVTVTWSASAKTITMTEGEKTGVLAIGSDLFQAGSRSVQLSAPAQNINGSAMIPLRAVAEYFGADVAWDAENRTVALTKQTLSVTDKTYQKEVKAEDGSVLALATAVYPVVSADAEKTEEVNQTIANIARNAVDTYAQAITEVVTEEFEALGADFRPYQMVISYQDVYGTDTILSYLMTAGEYRGGANGTEKAFGMVLDLTTGEQLALTDFVSLANGQTTHDYLTDIFRNDMVQHPDRYLAGAEATLADENTNLSFYLKDSKTLVATADQTSIQPHSSGIVKVEVDLSVK